MTSDTIRVLVVDDDFRVAGLHRDIVAARPGFTALEPVHSLGAARAAIRAHAPDLLLVDAYLPDGHGTELVHESGLDAFMLSAATDAKTVRRAVNAGVLRYFVKPFDARVLADRLDRYARYRNLLDTDRPLAQDQIDRAFDILHAATDAGSMSRSATEQLILDGLGEDEASASEVAERIGVSRATAQRHLAALAARGVVEVRLRYGTTGRPEHRYGAAHA
jgi:response regulator of citrate/malate metabolism